MIHFSVGEIVSSLKGRDQGKLYIIYQINNDRVVLVNGDDKTFAHTKLKNIKHISSEGQIAEVLKAKFSDQKQVFDAEVYSTLKKFRENKKGE